MNSKLRKERSRMIVDKNVAKSNADATYDAYIIFLERFAAADMALKEFERKYGSKK